ncbi:hypothetical protein BJ965_007014 [Streptomyces luteogriseus]|uniref:Secreted protein n=1 Tax=Streptomyces luteogriseus TaxID=68233 RepID=A0A7W7DXB7_9ACTN|nr:hypothetical protein [Streptomyces luteogriseus]
MPGQRKGTPSAWALAAAARATTLCYSTAEAATPSPAHADFSGQRANWSGDDGWWESWIADEDSSWANHGISGPGIKDHVKVYSSAGQGGQTTICLTPGQEVGHNGVANDRGDSHTWAMSC